VAATKAELFERIRGDSWREGLSVRALARRYGVHRRLVREALTHAEPGRVSVFPHEICKAPRSWAERAYPSLIYFNEVDRGQSLRCLAGTGAVYHRGPRRVPVIALAGRPGHSRHG
jgi:hypothetical protein